MTDFLLGQMDYIYFFYGLAFILLAPICHLLKRRPPPQPAWVWLGTFGAAYGVNEWLDLLAMTPSITPVIALIKLVLATLSFLFLLEFGRASMIALGRRSPGRWVWLALLGLAGLGGLLAGLPGYSATSRYALALVGGLWAAGALHLASRAPGPGRWALQGAALGLLLYGLTGGLVVKPAPFFPASLINSDSFLAATGWPIQLVKGLAALWTSACLCLFAQASLAKEADPRIRVWVRNLLMGAAAGVIILLVCGWLLTQRLGNEALQAERSNQEYTGEILQGVMLDKMAGAERIVAVMSGSPWVVPALATGQPGRVQEANEVLDRYSQAFPQSVCYLMDLKGVTIASSNRGQPDSFVGKSYAFRPYFQQASQGSPGRYWALGVTSRELGYYASAPVRNGGGKIVGVAVIKIPLSGMGGFFPKQALFFVIDSHGIVVLANRPGLVVQSLWPLSAAAREEVVASRQFGDGPFRPILTQAPVDRGEVRFQGERLLVLRRPFPGEGWSAVILSSMRPIAMARLFGIGITLFLCWVLIGLLTIIGMTIEATARIQRSERNYRDLYGRLRDGSVSVTLEGRIVEFNPAFQEMLGYAPEEIYRLTYKDITPEKWQPLDAKIIEEQVLPRGYSDIYEKEYRRQDGAVIPVELQTYLVRDAAGHPAGLWAFVRNITLRKEAEDALRDSEQKYRLLVTDVPAMVYRGYADWSVDFFDDKIEELTGYTRDDFHTRRIKWSDLILAEDLEGAKEVFKQALKTDKAFVREYRIRSRLGAIRWIRERGKIVCNQDGRINHVSGVFSDITQRRQTEAALERLRLQNELILASAGQGIFGLDLEGNTTFINPAALAMTGYESKEMLGQNIHELIHYRKADGTRNPDEECPMGRTLRYGEVHRVVDDLFWTKAGQPLPVEYVTTPIRENGNLVGAVGVFRDITERKAAEKELQKANKQLTMLVAGVEERNRQMTLLNEMGDVLQTCQSFEEAYQVIRNFMPKFFPTFAGGALYMLNHSQNLFQEVAVWGKSLLSEKVFAPDECWALRRGRLHQVDNPGAEMSCRHVPQPLQAGYLCVPLMDRSMAMGILYLQASGLILSDLKEPYAQIAATLGEGMASALANLKLRETLQSQAIRDSLTGLFNRRYLEETLERELHRVKRLGFPLGVVMIDLDHFKQYNDNFGHNAGDELLVALGHLILSLVRAEDIPCRFGGEEFLLIIPGASLEVTLERAEKLRLGVKQLHEQHPGKFLHPVTISAGVAVFPGHGESADVLIRAADAALYQAKREGRDRVVAAG